MPTYLTWLRLLMKAFPAISFPSEPAVKWTPISQPLEPVVAEFVLVGVIDKHALFGADARAARECERFDLFGRGQTVLSRFRAAHARTGPASRRLQPSMHYVAANLGAVGKVEQQAPVAIAV